MSIEHKDEALEGGIGGAEQHVYHLTRTLLYYQQENLFCDTAIVTQNGMVFAHSVILAAICPTMFASLNQNPFIEHQANVIELSQYTSETIGKLLQFFYTGKLGKSDIMELQEVFEKLGIILQLADAVSVDWTDECLKKGILGFETLAPDDKDALSNLCPEIPSTDKNKEVVVQEKHNSDWMLVNGNDTQTKSIDSTAEVSESTQKLADEPQKKNVTSNIDNRAAIKVESEFSCVCSFCKKQFTSQRRLNSHKWIHYQTECGNYQCNTCAKMYPKKDALRKHLKTHGLKCKSYVCPICSHQFLFLSRLQNHMNTHTNAKPFMCDVCGRCFNDRDYLNKHKRIHHEDRRYLCGTCGKRFVMNNAYKTHLLTHTGEKPFKCNICFQQFTQRHSLKVHKLLHSNETPHHCEYCEREFRRATRLKIHVLTVHTNNAAKPFHCQICFKGFSTRCYLQQHIPTHNRTSQCALCGKTFPGITSRKKMKQFCSDCVVENRSYTDPD